MAIVQASRVRYRFEGVGVCASVVGFRVQGLRFRRKKGLGIQDMRFWVRERPRNRTTKSKP